MKKVEDYADDYHAYENSLNKYIEREENQQKRLLRKIISKLC